MSASNSASPSAEIPLRRRLIYYGVTLLVFAVVVELSLSIVDPQQIMVRAEDPEVIYSLYPDQSGVAETPEYRVEVATDALGLRTCPAAPERFTEDPLPILILGDSFAEGWGVECREGFAGRLRRRLAPEARVYNGGMHGGSPAYYVLRARKLVPELRPRTLIVQIFDNDLDDLDRLRPFLKLEEDGRIAGAAPDGLGPLPAGAFSRWIRELATYRLARRIYKSLADQPEPIKYYKPGREPGFDTLSHAESLEQFGRPAPLDDLDQDYGGQFAFYKFDSLPQLMNSPIDALLRNADAPGAYARITEDDVRRWRDRFRRMRIYLEQLRAESRRVAPDQELVVLYIPANEVFGPGGIRKQFCAGDSASIECRRGELAQLRATNPLYQLLAAFAAEDPATRLVDGQAIFYDEPEELYFPGDAHLNARGHQVAAEALERAIRQSL